MGLEAGRPGSFRPEGHSGLEALWAFVGLEAPWAWRPYRPGGPTGLEALITFWVDQKVVLACTLPFWIALCHFGKPFAILACVLPFGSLSHFGLRIVISACAFPFWQHFDASACTVPFWLALCHISLRFAILARV